MNVVHQTILASVFGAGLFFLAGYLLRSLRASQEPAPRLDPTTSSGDQDATAERARWRRQVEEAAASQRAAEARAAGLARELGELRVSQDELEELRAARQELTREREELARQVTTLQSEAVELRRAAEAGGAGRAAEVKALRDKLDKVEAERSLLEHQAAEARTLREEVQSLEAQVTELASQVEASMPEQTQITAPNPATEALLQLDALEKEKHALEGKVARYQRQLAESQKKLSELPKLRSALADAQKRLARIPELERHAARSTALVEEKEALEASLGELRAASVPKEELDQLRKKQRNMLVQAQMMRQHVSELERHADENVLLKQQLVHYGELLAEVEGLRHRVKDLKAALFAAGVGDATPVSEDASRQVATPEMATSRDEDGARDTSLDRTLGQVLAAGGAESAALADLHGLLLASSGESAHHEALGIFSSMLGDLAQRAREMLPIAGLHRVDLVDVHGTQVVSRWFDDGDQPLAVTLLGRRTSKLTALDDLAARISRAIEAQG